MGLDYFGKINYLAERVAELKLNADSNFNNQMKLILDKEDQLNEIIYDNDQIIRRAELYGAFGEKRR